jgi:NADPH:quinone reductase
MRAAVVERVGEPPRPGEAPEPARREGDALIQVQAASINPIDANVAAGRFYLGPPGAPYVPGREGVGTVMEAANTVPGTLVRFEVNAGYDGRGGSIGERAAAPEDDLIPVPEGTDPRFAAGIGIVGMAAWLALERRGRLQRGETVLVLAASGAVGQVAVQAARVLGAGRVVAAARSEEGLRRAEERGADATVQLEEGLSRAELAERFREAAGGDVDLCVDPVWGEPAMAALEALAIEGRLVHLGQSAGDRAEVSSAPLRGRSRAILGHSNLVTPEEARRDAFEKLCRHANAGRLRLDLEVVGLDRVEEAWQRQGSAHGRKLVITP